jgi:NAD+ diphosphatase
MRQDRRVVPLPGSDDGRTLPQDGLLAGLQMGGRSMDRAAHRRDEPAWLDEQWHAGNAVVVRFGADGSWIDTADEGTEGSRVIRPADPGTPRPAMFLGVFEGAAVFVDVVATTADAERTPAQRYATLRTLGTSMSDIELDVIAHATGLVNWQQRHRFCPRCGSDTRVMASGHLIECTSCGTQHYPRTDPAVIVLVTDDDDRALLGRQASWPKGRFSTLAGFVEPGESAETAVRREVHEESGIRLGEVRYAGSQPWPFPGSLMLGFLADAVSTRITVDGVELAQAHWFSREELRIAMTSGEVLVPPGISISRRLIEHWFGESLGSDRIFGG